MKLVRFAFYVFVLLFVWQIISYFLKTSSFPLASEVILDIYGNFTYYCQEAFETFIIILKSLIPAVLFGYVLAFVLDYSKLTSQLLNPLINFTQILPKTALLPLFVSIPLLGYSNRTKFLIIFLICFYPVFIEVYNGLNLTGKKYLKLFKIHNASQRDIIVKLKIPSTIPFLISGLRISILYSILGAVTSEIIVGGSGLGFLIDDSSQRLNFIRTYGGLVIVAVFGYISLLIFTLLTRKINNKYTYES
ncbi:MAG: ABC transporter permease subunit [Ferruginibacter sp.]|nr:ABC transporter permease subunit [Ferruginibacter sp.]